VQKTYVRALLLACALSLFLGALAPPRAADAAVTRAQTIAQIDDLRRQTWRLQRLMGKKRTPTFYDERRTSDAEYRVWIRKLWQRRAAAALRQAKRPPRRAAWMCIHRHERHTAQGWATRTGNGYYGGLQMDISFQRTYAPELLRRKGTANNWTSYEQMWVAWRAYKSGRGFYPWPNTARSCGLI
jgi:hypothetical protein